MHFRLNIQCYFEQMSCGQNSRSSSKYSKLNHGQQDILVAFNQFYESTAGKAHHAGISTSAFHHLDRFTISCLTFIQFEYHAAAV